MTCSRERLGFQRREWESGRVGELGGEKEELLIEKQHLVELVKA